MKETGTNTIVYRLLVNYNDELLDCPLLENCTEMNQPPIIFVYDMYYYCTTALYMTCTITVLHSFGYQKT